jgi:U3 small nucleolar RNA-associated protein 18
LTAAHAKQEKDDILETEETHEERKTNYEHREAKRARLREEAEEESRLTSLLFGGGLGSAGGDGGGDGGTKASAAWHDDDEDEDEEEDSDGMQEDDSKNDGNLFQIDRAGIYESNKNDDDDAEEEPLASAWNSEEEDFDDEDEGKAATLTNAAAWVDDDDEQVTVSLAHRADRLKKLRTHLKEDEVDGGDYERRLRDRFQATTSATARTDWADVDEVDMDAAMDATTDGKQAADSDDDTSDYEDTATKMLSSTAPLLSSTSTRLPPNVIDILRRPDANVSNYNDCTIQAVEFHPGSDEDEPLMLTAGLDKTLRFFKIENDGERSSKIHGIHFPNLPIHSASFLGDSGSVVVSGRRPFFYIYDAVAGKVRYCICLHSFVIYNAACCLGHFSHI